MLESEDDSRRNGVTAEKTLLTAEDLEALSAAAVDGTTKDSLVYTRAAGRSS